MYTTTISPSDPPDGVPAVAVGYIFLRPAVPYEADDEADGILIVNKEITSGA